MTDADISDFCTGGIFNGLSFTYPSSLLQGHSRVEVRRVHAHPSGGRKATQDKCDRLIHKLPTLPVPFAIVWRYSRVGIGRRRLHSLDDLSSVVLMMCFY